MASQQHLAPRFCFYSPRQHFCEPSHTCNATGHPAGNSVCQDGTSMRLDNDSVSPAQANQSQDPRQASRSGKASAVRDSMAGRQARPSQPGQPAAKPTGSGKSGHAHLATMPGQKTHRLSAMPCQLVQPGRPASPCSLPRPGQPSQPAQEPDRTGTGTGLEPDRTGLCTRLFSRLYSIRYCK